MILFRMSRATSPNSNWAAGAGGATVTALSQLTTLSVSTRSTWKVARSLALAPSALKAGSSMTIALIEGSSRTTEQPTLCASSRHLSVLTPGLQATIFRTVSPASSGQNCARAVEAMRVSNAAATRGRGLMGLLLTGSLGPRVGHGAQALLGPKAYI